MKNLSDALRAIRELRPCYELKYKLESEERKHRMLPKSPHCGLIDKTLQKMFTKGRADVDGCQLGARKGGSYCRFQDLRRLSLGWRPNGRDNVSRCHSLW